MTPSVDDPADGAGDLDGLRAALRAATPRPDPATRDAHIALARENFARLQGPEDGARPAARRRRVGVAAMLAALTPRGGLTAAVALVACGLVLTPAGRDLWRREPTLATAGAPVGADPAAPEPAPEPAPYAAGQAAEAIAKRTDGAAAGAPASGPSPAGDLDLAEARSAEGAPEPPRARDGAGPEAALDGTAGDAALARPPAAPSPAAIASAQAPPAASPDAESVASMGEESFGAASEGDVPTGLEGPSYAAVRRSLAAGALPPAEAVRVGEMINSFPYDYPAPSAGEGPLRPTVSVLPTPWNPATRLVSIAVQGERAAASSMPIAREVEAEVEWNPAAIAAGRLLGHETPPRTGSDLGAGPIALGTIGAGQSVTAIYEVTPTGPPASGAAAVDLGVLRLRWTAPDGTSPGLETPIVADAPPTDREARFAAAIAGWAQLLRGSDRLGDWGYDEAIALADANRGADPSGRRAEALRLMLLSRRLAE